MESNRIGRAVISAGCFIAASICVGAGYFLPALLMVGKNYSSPEEGFQIHSQHSSGLFFIGGLLFLTAVALAAWTLVPPRRPAS